MNKNLVFAIAGLVAGVAVALAAMKFVLPDPVDVKATRCPSGLGDKDRCIEVNVITVGGQLQIADISDVTMSAPGAIWWVSKTAGYTFPANGIDFVNPGTPPPGSPPKTPATSSEIDGCTPMAPGDARFKCVNKHPTSGKTYGYKVTLVNGGTTLTKDPFIVNN